MVYFRLAGHPGVTLGPEHQLLLPGDLQEHENECDPHDQYFQPVVHSEGFKVIHLFHIHFVPAGFHASANTGAAQPV